MGNDYRISREYKKAVGKRLADLRNELGLTQAEVAEQIEVDRALVSQWENGIRTPDVPSWIKLASFYNVSTDYIAGTSTQRTFKGSSTSDKLDLDKLSPFGRHLIFNLYHSLIEEPDTREQVKKR